MKIPHTLFMIALSFTLATPAWPCLMLVNDEHTKKVAESAYFIGMVQGDYIHQTAGGFLKEVGLIPVLVYKADSSVKFDELIVISNEKPQKSSCDAPVPRRGELMEVLIVKMDGRLKMLRMGNLQTEKKNQLMDELRSKARYVAPDYNIALRKNKQPANK